ncbi:hypothetical protein [Enterococcus pallens]|uniref:Uncharacterized protein n=1 Tax=Enterococcus pallens ATCC BAA-351 TaxID=1158607 RepID=R2SHN6_9ENTE|nr:hypothetical protein [Enterococcus pallens]EOH94790.1 hypothetical protein UAU_01712 [Enterococcus pallens ATCC BAA-351]EOU14891.1 hypothetical protein I588_04541 [Enterococcus pallens ATCC BAA-351]OJG78151.1 hypothetical protein RV10_GL001639 [Enterococcus pallens]
MKIIVQLITGGIAIYENNEPITHGKTLIRCINQGAKKIMVKN